MAGHLLKLHGCTPEPLGNYLKGLGVFRLIAEQADPQARAWWKDGVLNLLTTLSKEKVADFFLNGIGENKTPIYCPTPIFAPWGGRPGFYKDGNEKAKSRLKVIRELNPPGRFSASQESIKQIEAILKQRGWTDVPKKKREKIKTDIIASMRNQWNDSAVNWFDASISLEEDACFGFLYGTGGNEGSADITNNFWELIEETLGLPTPRPDSDELLVASIFGAPRASSTSRTAGQHFPLAAGSSNCGQDFEGSASTNPWDFILMMEGAVLFAGATTKRLSQYGKGKSAFPFMINHLATEGQASSIKDEAKQDAKVIRCRAEFWMPLCSEPTSLTEIASMLTEGRLQRRSGEQTEHTLHAMEAIRTLGTARGIDTFHRVGLFERRGKGYYLASSLGYHSTSGSSDIFASQLAEIERFRQQVYRKLREGPGMPERILNARKHFHHAIALLLESDAIVAYTTDPLLETLVGIAGIEFELSLHKDRTKLLSPCPALSSKWLPKNNNSECRLARAIAGISHWGETSDSGRTVPVVQSLRSNLLPLAQRGKAWVWDDTTRSNVWSRAAPLETNLAAVLRRRMIDSRRGKGEGLPLWSSFSARFSDILALLQGAIDETRLTDLIFGFSLIDSGYWASTTIQNRQQRDEPTPNLQTTAVWFDADDQARTRLPSIQWKERPLLSKEDLQAAFELPRVYHLLKLCFVGGQLPRRPLEGHTVQRTGDEPYPPWCLDVLTLLQGGSLAQAVSLAARRLRAKGYPPILREDDIQSLDMDLDQCRRLAGILIIPVQQPSVCAALTIKPGTIN